GENGKKSRILPATFFTASVTLPIAPLIPSAIEVTIFLPASLNLPKNPLTALNAPLIPDRTAFFTPLNALDTIPFSPLNMLENVDLTNPSPEVTKPPIALNPLEKNPVIALQPPLIILVNPLIKLRAIPIIFPMNHKLTKLNKNCTAPLMIFLIDSHKAVQLPVNKAENASITPVITDSAPSITPLM